MRYKLFGAGIQGKSPKVTAQKRQNCYFEFVPEGEHTQVAIYGIPGLESFVSFGDTPVRGMHSFFLNSKLYIVHRATFWEVDNAGTKTSRGTLDTTSGRVYMDDNGVQICIVDGTYGYTYNTSTTTFAKITDAQFPTSPTSVTCHYSRFIVSKGGTGQFYGSAISDGTSWAALDFATAESNPDGLVKLDARDELIVWGELTTEFWANTGSGGFPYARIPGTNLEWGLAARASVARFDGSFAFLAKNKEGEVIVAKLNGFQMERISNFELEHIINGYSTVSDATGFAYMLGGHPMYQINFPTGMTSWLYDGSTGIWSRMKSYDIERHRAEIQANFVDKNYVSDYSTGVVYRVNPLVYTENGESIEIELISRHLVDDDEIFKASSLEIVMESGLGLESGQGSNPQVMFSISKDGGHTFYNERWTSAGKIGQYQRRVRFRRPFGRKRDVVCKIRITDPVPVRIVAENVIPS